MPKVNPDIMRWARETAGLTLEDAATKIELRQARGVSGADRLAALESSDEGTEPTRALLTRMAKQYRRPLLTFYLTAPPRKGDRGQDFRTLPEDHSDADEALLDALIRDVKARQSMVRAMLEDEEDTEHLPFVGSLRISQGVSAVLSSIQQTIQLDIAEFRAEPSASDAFTVLRDRVEAAGIFVLLIGNLGSHHTAIDLETFRGFALADDIAPFVIINDQDAHSAWSFTLLHELVHIWLGQTGVSGLSAEISIEKFCNDVASEFLLPRSDIQQLDVDAATDLQSAQRRIAQFAMDRNLSASMVAYKLHRMGTLDFERWKLLSQTFRRMWIDRRNDRRRRAREQETRGPSYYRLRRHRIGKALINLVDSMMHAGAITTSKAGIVLGVKAKNVQNLLGAGRFV